MAELARLCLFAAPTAAARIARESNAHAAPRPKSKTLTVRFELTLGDTVQMSRDLKAIGVAIGKAIVVLGGFWSHRNDPDYQAAAQAAVAAVLRPAARHANAYGRRNIPQDQPAARDQARSE